MIDLDHAHLAAFALCEPLNIRTVAFDVPTFDLLKRFQRKPERLIFCHTGIAEVLKYLIFSHSEVQAIRP